MKVEWGDGWALLRDPEDVPERLRRPIVNRMMQFGDIDLDNPAKDFGPAQMAGMQEMTDLLIVALVESWSFDKPITADTVIDLPGRAYKALERECSPHLTKMFPDFTVTPDRDSPTPASPA